MVKIIDTTNNYCHWINGTMSPAYHNLAKTVTGKKRYCKTIRQVSQACAITALETVLSSTSGHAMLYQVCDNSHDITVNIDLPVCVADARQTVINACNDNGMIF